jgi:hypothetical protein
MPSHEQIMEAHQTLDREYGLATGKTLDQETPESIEASLPTLAEKEKSLRGQADNMSGQLARAETHLEIAMRNELAIIAMNPKPMQGKTSTTENPVFYQGKKIPNGMTESQLRRGLKVEGKRGLATEIYLHSIYSTNGLNH